MDDLSLRVAIRNGIECCLQRAEVTGTILGHAPIRGLARARQGQRTEPSEHVNKMMPPHQKATAHLDRQSIWNIPR